MDNEYLKIDYNIELKRVDKQGNVIDTLKVHNLVTSAGKERVAELIGKISTAGFDYIGIGTGTTAPVVGDTTLETEVDRQLATTISEPVSGQVKFEKTFTFGTTYDITELGLLSLAVAGILFNRATFTARSVSAVIDLIATVTITVS